MVCGMGGMSLRRQKLHNCWPTPCPILFDRWSTHLSVAFMLLAILVLTLVADPVGSPMTSKYCSVQYLHMRDVDHDPAKQLDDWMFLMCSCCQWWQWAVSLGRWPFVKKSYLSWTHWLEMPATLTSKAAQRTNTAKSTFCYRWLAVVMFAYIMSAYN